MADQGIYLSDRTRVFRTSVSGSGGDLIGKQPLGADALDRVDRERAVLEQVADVPGVVKLAAGVDQPPDVLLLENAGSRSLAGGRFDVDTVVDLATGLAETLNLVHERGIVHRDISPANVVRAADGSPVLIDFDHATIISGDRSGLAHQGPTAVTPVYTAPEQTGRTGWLVDHRADLYSLGATLYELLVGAPPFGAGEPLQLVHDHLASIPVPPDSLVSAVPGGLSAVVMRLLEKEPDRRYQSASGLAYDLRRLRRLLATGEAEVFVPGEHDFAARLDAPSRPVGREAERAVLADAFAGSLSGATRALLVSGRAGVGKSTLLDELRPVVTSAGGWFVTGKFDQFRQAADGVRDALRSLVRILLTEPPDRAARLRDALLDRLGTNAALACAALPELGTLLGIEPEAVDGDPMAAQPRLQQAALGILRAVADPDCPLVMVVDDIQWAGSLPMGFLDSYLLAEALPGVLVVASYRDDHLSGHYPLAAMLSRWQELGVAPPAIHLADLTGESLAELIAKVLRVKPDEATDLVGVIAERTGGNPFDTIELINNLRRDGVLSVQRGGWTWDAGAVRGGAGADDVTERLAEQIDALPDESQSLIDIMACIGGSLSRQCLSVAAGGLSTKDLDARSAPPLRAGLIVLDETGTLAFRHDRVQQAAADRLADECGVALRLMVARRLAAVPALARIAAEQYLAVLSAVDDEAERRHVAQLLIAGADDARSLAEHQATERFLQAALGLLRADRSPGAGSEADAELIRQVIVSWHAALVGLRRFDEADQAFALLAERHDGPLPISDAAWVQVTSLTAQARLGEAVSLGLRQLTDLGLAVPSDPAEVRAGIGAGLALLHQIAASVPSEAPEEDGDEPVTAIANMLAATIPAAFFSDQPMMAWLVSQAVRMWADHGPHPALTAPLANTCFVINAVREDYRTGREVMTRVIAAGRAGGHEPGTSEAVFKYALGSGCWFEPLEDMVRLSRDARAGLIRAGAGPLASATWYVSLPDLLDCAATVDELSDDVDAALTYTQQVGNTQAAEAFTAYRQFVRAMRGQTDAPGSFTDAGYDETTVLAGLVANPTAAANVRITRALAALIVGDPAALIQHATAVAPLLPFIQSTYLTVAGHLVQAMALIEQSRTDPQPAELTRHLDWFTARSQDAPMNLSHLELLLRAEQSALAGDTAAAVTGFAAAATAAATQIRPWHSALIAHRAAEFYLALNAGNVAAPLLQDAESRYRRWGAPAVTSVLRSRHADLSGDSETDNDPAGGSGELTAERIDLLGVIAASQALSSETSLPRLLARVTDTLGALTGATSVRVLLHHDNTWYLPQDDGDSGLPVDQAAADRLLPMSVFRYAERTQQIVTVDDVSRDERFCRDPYFRHADRWSLLAVPILNRNSPQAMVLLENRLARGAFAGDRLDAVTLIVGQLAVSLDNARLYASLERRVAARTKDLADANQRLELLSQTDPLTGLANRRYLDTVLDRLWTQAPEQNLAVIILDIDHFKNFNDRYGHLAGDDCLRAVADALTRSLRANDLLARFGGEEFVAVLPDSTLASGLAVAQRLHTSITNLAYPHADSPEQILTVSVGVAAATPADLISPEDLLSRADEQLYEAKNTGRNHIRPRQEAPPRPQRDPCIDGPSRL